MDVHNVREQMKLKSIYEIPMRVTFYARVSSEKDEQLNSLDNQISYYQKLIKNNSYWQYVDGYIDEGISGISTKNRESFHRMIDDANRGKFDLIITKEISRFARNTLDSIRYTRELLNNGVGIFFQNDNINTLDEDSELRLSIMSSIAQDELRKLSSRIKFGHAQAIQNKVVLGNSRIFGYNKRNKKLVINEQEAKMVRELFELYSTGNYSMKQIENIFWEKGYRNHNGNKIAHTTMSNTISNPKYKGYYCGNKVKTIDMFTKKQKFLPPEDWVMFKDETGEIVPAIVSEELWERANAVLSRRSRDVKNRQGKCNHPNLLTGKLICTKCGVSYYRRDSKNTDGKNNSKWVCSGKIKNGATSCDSFAIYENEIKDVIFKVFNEDASNIDDLIEDYITLYKKNDTKHEIEKEIIELKKAQQLEEAKKEKLLEHNLNGRIDDDDYARMNRICVKKIKDINEQLLKLKEKQSTDMEFYQHIAEIRHTLNQAKKDASQDLITKAFVDTYIDKIYVTPIPPDEVHSKNMSGSTVKLEIKLFTGKVYCEYLENTRCRAGQFSNDKCPVRTYSYERYTRTLDNYTCRVNYEVYIDFD